ncbi:hypothetical protein Tco_1400750 [Tanacetum coccineum]
MLPTRRATRTTPATTTTPTTTVTNAQLQALIDQGVAAALAERDASRSRDGDNSHGSGTGGRRQVPTQRECTYTDFLKCQPINFKGTEGVVGLTAVGQDVAYTMPWTALKRMITDKYCPRGEIKKLESEYWNLKVRKAFKPQSLQGQLIFCHTEMMDQKVESLFQLNAKQRIKGNLRYFKEQPKQQHIQKGKQCGTGYTAGLEISQPLIWRKQYLYYPSAIITTMGHVLKSALTAKRLVTRPVTVNFDLLLTTTTTTTTTITRGTKGQIHELSLALNVSAVTNRRDCPKLKYGKSRESGWNGLCYACRGTSWLILELLKKEQLYAKFSKCEFWIPKVQFLGQSDRQSGAPILALPEGNEDFIAYCDASIKGLGAVLMQRRKRVWLPLPTVVLRTLIMHEFTSRSILFNPGFEWCSDKIVPGHEARVFVTRWHNMKADIAHMLASFELFKSQRGRNTIKTIWLYGTTRIPSMEIVRISLWTLSPNSPKNAKLWVLGLDKEYGHTSGADGQSERTIQILEIDTALLPRSIKAAHSRHFMAEKVVDRLSCWADRRSEMSAHRPDLFMKQYREDLSKLSSECKLLCENAKRVYADVRRIALEFQVGDRVMLKPKWEPVRYCLVPTKQLSRVHSIFHVSNLKKCLSDEPLAVPLDEIHIDDKLHFVEEQWKSWSREIKKLRRSRIPIIKVRWNSKRGPEFTWEREDQFREKYPHLFTKTAPSKNVAS